MARIAEVCSTPGPVHVQIEGSRLMASLVKNCQDSVVMGEVVRGGGVKWIVHLLASEHSLLTNEGVVALNLLSVAQQGDSVVIKELCSIVDLVVELCFQI